MLITYSSFGMLHTDLDQIKSLKESCRKNQKALKNSFQRNSASYRIISLKEKVYLKVYSSVPLSYSKFQKYLFYYHTFQKVG